MNTKQEVIRAQQVATAWLRDKLKLGVHERNNVIIKASQGLLFLGHKIHPLSPISVDKHMLTKILAELDVNNAASYQAMHVPRRKIKLLPWLLRQ